MRLNTLTTSALAAAAALLLHPVPVAAQPDSPVTSVSTYTITRTVERVVETTWATLSLTPSTAIDTELPHEPTLAPARVASPAASASMAPLPLHNGTQPALGSSGGMPSGTVSVMPQASGNAASPVGGQGYALAAVAGILGLIVL